MDFPLAAATAVMFKWEGGVADEGAKAGMKVERLESRKAVRCMMSIRNKA